MKVLYLVSNEKKNSAKELKKIEARLSERKQKMYSLKIKCQNVKRKLNNMEQVQMEYLEMDIQKVNEFYFLNEEVEGFISRRIQYLVNLTRTCYLKSKTLNIVYEA